MKIERQFKRVFRKVNPEDSVSRTAEPDKCEPRGRYEPGKTA